jgi:hypothetical protein
MAAFEILMQFGEDQTVVLTDGQTFPQPSPVQRMVLPIVLQEQDRLRRLGTGLHLAPGVVLTARHVLDGQMPRIRAADCAPGVLFISDQNVPGQEEGPWFKLLPITHISMSEESPLSQSDHLGPDEREYRGHDLALLTTSVAFIGKEPASSIVLPLSFSRPSLGSAVLAMGYPKLPDEVESEDSAPLLGDLLAVQGTVKEIHSPYRDRTLIPFPVLESDYPDTNGMSGGPVIREDGCVVAIVCRSFDGNDPSYSSLLPPALNLTVTLEEGEVITLYDLIERGAVLSDGSHRFFRAVDGAELAD